MSAYHRGFMDLPHMGYIMLISISFLKNMTGKDPHCNQETCNTSVFPCNQKEALGMHIHMVIPVYDISGNLNYLTHQFDYIRLPQGT